MDETMVRSSGGRMATLPAGIGGNLLEGLSGRLAARHRAWPAQRIPDAVDGQANAGKA